MKKKSPSLYVTLFYLGLVSVVLSMSLAYALISSQLNGFFVEASVKKNTEISKSIATFIDDKLMDAVNQLQLIDKAIDPQRMEKQTVNELIFNMNGVSQSFLDIEVVDNDGQVLYTLPIHSDEIGFDRSREPFYTAYVSDKPVYWSTVQLSPYSAVNTIALAVKSRIGYLVGYLDLKEIQALSEIFISQFGTDKDITITDEYGIFLVNKNGWLVEERRLDPHHEMALKILAGQNLYIHQENDSERFVIASSLIGTTNWIVSISEPYAIATGGVNTMIRLLISFAGFMLVGYALLLWRGNKKVIRDIQTFTNRLSATSKGLDTASVKGYFKEFKSLHESFNDMVGKIAERDKKLTHLAYHDALTGFYNRLYLDNVVTKLLDNTELPYAVAYIDLDNFSHVNDSYGHHVGDLLLVGLSNALESVITKETEIIRLGGDEFILIIRSDKDIAEVTKQTMMDILSISNDPIRVKERSIYFTMSAGISFYPQDGTDFWTLLKNADTAMYAAKSEGKNKFKYFTTQMNKIVEDQLVIEQFLRPALKNNEFRLEFQPQLTVDGMTIRGFEALIRWENPILGLVNPTDFIFAAEENRSIIQIGHWVMKVACDKIRELNTTYNATWVIAVNVSPVELKETNYAITVERIINETGIDPKWLEVEITENISIDIFTQLSQTLEELHRLGISISIDDFGTGYSSLSYLQRIPLDVLKIDRTFITHLGEVNDYNLMTETIFLMARKLGLLTIAEGVETQFHIDQLKTMNCDFIQGYIISKPLPYNKLLDFINTKFGKGRIL